MAAYAYFVAFIVSGSFFILNLFIGVIIENFNQLKQQVGDVELLLSCDSFSDKRIENLS